MSKTVYVWNDKDAVCVALNEDRAKYDDGYLFKQYISKKITDQMSEEELREHIVDRFGGPNEKVDVWFGARIGLLIFCEKGVVPERSTMELSEDSFVIHTTLSGDVAGLVWEDCFQSWQKTYDRLSQAVYIWVDHPFTTDPYGHFHHDWNVFVSVIPQRVGVERNQDQLNKHITGVFGPDTDLSICYFEKSGTFVIKKAGDNKASPYDSLSQDAAEKIYKSGRVYFDVYKYFKDYFRN